KDRRSGWQRFLGWAVMGRERLRSDGQRQHGCGKRLERRIVCDAKMLVLERVKREDIAVRTVGRPWAAITPAEAGNVKRHKIAVGAAGSGGEGPRCCFALPQVVVGGRKGQPRASGRMRAGN